MHRERFLLPTNLRPLAKFRENRYRAEPAEKECLEKTRRKIQWSFSVTQRATMNLSTAMMSREPALVDGRVGFPLAVVVEVEWQRTGRHQRPDFTP